MGPTAPGLLGGEKDKGGENDEERNRSSTSPLYKSEHRALSNLSSDGSVTGRRISFQHHHHGETAATTLPRENR